MHTNPAADLHELPYLNEDAAEPLVVFVLRRCMEDRH